MRSAHLRIVSGRWRGRAINSPKGDVVRPTLDRVREALFSMLASRLGADLGGARVLDAFAGSGALGLEALSRGASSAVFVEQDPGVRRVLEANIASLGASPEARVVPGDVFALAQRAAVPGGPFTLILLDPPYRIDAARVRGLLGDLQRDGVVGPGALVVYEHEAHASPEWPDGFESEVTRQYGSIGIDLAIACGD